jgi:hypothetical protein
LDFAKICLVGTPGFEPPGTPHCPQEIWRVSEKNDDLETRDHAAMIRESRAQRKPRNPVVRVVIKVADRNTGTEAFSPK